MADKRRPQIRLPLHYRSRARRVTIDLHQGTVHQDDMRIVLNSGSYYVALPKRFCRLAGLGPGSRLTAHGRYRGKHIFLTLKKPAAADEEVAISH